MLWIIDIGNQRYIEQMQDEMLWIIDIGNQRYIEQMRKETCRRADSDRTADLSARSACQNVSGRIERFR